MIKFGTDGWRAIISDEFTFDNVRIVAQAIANYLVANKKTDHPIIVGYDPRFLADEFARECCRVLAKNGISSFIVERDAPTPVIAFTVKDRKAAGAIMLTASHNPAEYCGLKFIPEYAGPAGKDITSQIEKYVKDNSPLVDFEAVKRGEIESFDPKPRYVECIKSFFDIGLIKKAKLKVIYDPMYGCGRGYLDLLLQKFGVQVEVLHGYRDVLFGGSSPEPIDEHLSELKSKVEEFGADLGLANDGDADRFGIVDEKGVFYSANQVLPMLARYLIEVKKIPGCIVRSVATTSMLDAVADQKKVKLVEVPVGFKYIAEIMMKEKVVIGGEESGGLSILGHIPEKDGILADLLVVEMLAYYKKPLSEIYKDLEKMIGSHFQKRINLEMSEEIKNKLINQLKDSPPKELASHKVAKVNLMDGVKLILDDKSWLLMRPSGTEPLVRTYFESRDQNIMQQMQVWAEDLVRNI